MRICAVIPAHNEESHIEACFRSLCDQTYPLHRIVVVNDNSADGTGDVLRRLAGLYPQLTVVDKSYDGSMRAGAVNAGLSVLSSDECDLVLIVDADAVMAPDVVERGVEMFKRDGRIGGICSSADLRKPEEKGFMRHILYILQRLEYGGFNADRTATWKRVMIIHGLCGLYRLEALKEVGSYTLGILLEDYELTLKLKEKGWKTAFCPLMKAKTEAVPTVNGLLKQRMRWFVGGVDVLLSHGISRFTWFDALNHVIFILMFLIVITMSILGIVSYRIWEPRPFWHPIVIILLAIGFANAMWRLKWVEKLEKEEILIRLLLLPELGYSTLLSAVQIWAYVCVLAGAKRRW